MDIVFPDNCREIINAIRGVIGRNVDFYIPTTSGCDICSLDPVTNTSTDSFCPVCSGAYWIKSYTTLTVSGHITWAPSDTLSWYAGGKVFDGDCRISIEYTEENSDAVEDADYIVADNKELEIRKTTLRGFQPLNRIIIDAIERDREHA